MQLWKKGTFHKPRLVTAHCTLTAAGGQTTKNVNQEYTFKFQYTFVRL